MRKQGRNQAEIMKVRQKNWDHEKYNMEENRKLEYIIYDMLKALGDNNDKFKRIKLISEGVIRLSHI
jgi:hypothetical protein